MSEENKKSIPSIVFKLLHIEAALFLFLGLLVVLSTEKVRVFLAINGVNFDLLTLQIIGYTFCVMGVASMIIVPIIKKANNNETD